MARQKEQEIGKQTRQALVENEALSKTVERLQRRDFGKVRRLKRAITSRLSPSSVLVDNAISFVAGQRYSRSLVMADLRLQGAAGVWTSLKIWIRSTPYFKSFCVFAFAEKHNSLFTV